MAYEFTSQRRVEFAETDTAQIMHFSNFFVYMEQTEHAFLRSLGFSVHSKTDAGVIGFPRTAATCEYRHPLRFEDVVDVCLRVREKTDKRICYDFAFHNTTHDPPQVAARGSLTVICALLPADGGPMQAVAIPAEIAAAIEVAPPQA